MRDTELLLREHVKHLGKCGDIVRVKPGYARNYLIPRGIATSATEENKAAMARKRERLDAEEASLLADLDERIAVLEKLALETIERADDHGRLYGSVGAQRVVALLAEAGHTIEERAVRLVKPLKRVGIHEVPIHLHAERSATVKIEIEAEGAAEKAAQEAADAAAKAAGKAEAKAAASEGEDAADEGSEAL